MNKQIITFILTFIITFSSFAQSINKSKIDNLKTESEVENFIKSFNSIRSEFFKISNIKEIISKNVKKNSYCNTIVDSLKITKSFYKADLDQNGLTDILVIGDYYGFNIYVAMDFGNDNLKLFRLTRSNLKRCFVPKISKIGNKTVINLYYNNNVIICINGQEMEPKILKKVLVYKFDSFIEYNSNPKEYNIKKIEFQTSTCFGTCPKFKITIDKNRNAIFDAQKYNRKKRKGRKIKGKYKTSIKEEDFNNIISLLNYIDFPKLKDNYSVNWTDDQSCTLKITYDNGKIKEIHDYGLIGTIELNKLYFLLFELRYNQKWKKIKSR